MPVDWHSMIDEDEKGEIVPAVDAPFKEKATLVGRMGWMMLSTGVSAWRVRASMNKVSRALGIICNADIGLTSITYTCYNDVDHYTAHLNLPGAGLNTTKMHALKDFADGFSERAEKYSVQQFHRILDQLQKVTAGYGNTIIGLAAGFACAAFTYLLGGGIVEMLCALAGAGIGQFVRRKMLERHLTLVANVSVSVAVACILYVLLITLFERTVGHTTAHEAGYICAMLFIIPGFPLITGGMDFAKLELRSALERTSYAVLIIATATVTGWICAYYVQFKPGDLVHSELPEWLHIIFVIIASFVGVFGFSLMMGSRYPMALSAAFIGMTANTARILIVENLNVPAPAGAFIGTLLAGLIASFFKERIHFPRITQTVPAVVIMVPGMFMYKGIYYIGQADLSNAGLWLSKAFLIVFALPAGLIVARVLTDENFRKNS